MPQQPDPSSDPGLDFDGLTDVLAAIAMRAGTLFEFDQIAELKKPADRAMHAAVVVNKVATSDPSVGRVLAATKAVSIMRAEILRRRSQS